MRSSNVPVRILQFAPFGAPPPLIFSEAKLSCRAVREVLAKLGRKQKTRRENERTHARHCERSEAIEGPPP
jgi:hypothetical protein